MVDQIKDGNLLVDIGNSSIKWAILTTNGLSDMQQRIYPDNISSTFFIDCWKELVTPKEITGNIIRINPLLHI